MFIGIESTNTKAKEIIDKAVESYATLKAMDNNTKKNSLNPGESLGFANNYGFYYPENAVKCDEMLAGYRSELSNLLNDVKEEIKSKTSEPPTTEQANLLTVLSIGKPTKEELENAIESNINNYATFSALNRLAAENEMYFGYTSPVDDLKECEYSISSKMNRLYTSKAEESLSPASISFENFMTGRFGNV